MYRRVGSFARTRCSIAPLSSMRRAAFFEGGCGAAGSGDVGHGVPLGPRSVSNISPVPWILVISHLAEAEVGDAVRSCARRSRSSQRQRSQTVHA